MMERSCDMLAAAMGKCFDEAISADVKFKLEAGGSQIHAHKLVLAARSQVFKDMFNGEGTNSDEVTIADVDAKHMKAFLRYLYTDQVELNQENIEKILHLADNYKVFLLFEECANFLISHLDNESTFFVFQLGKKYCSEKLRTASLNHIGINANECLRSQALLDFSKEDVEDIIKCKNLICEEERIFEFLCRWAEKACEANEKNKTAENKRAALGRLLYDVRFPIMKYNYLIDSVSKTGILTESEMMNILQQTVNKSRSDNAVDSMFINTCRKSDSSLSVCLRTIGTLSLITTLEGLNDVQNIEFTLSDDSWFYGVLVFSPKHNERFGIELTLRDETTHEKLVSDSAITAAPNEHETFCSHKLHSPVYLNKAHDYECSVKFYHARPCEFHCFSENVSQRSTGQSHQFAQPASFSSPIYSELGIKRKRNLSSASAKHIEFSYKKLTVYSSGKFIAGLLLF